MRQCRKIASQQEAAKASPESVVQVEEPESPTEKEALMNNAHELEKYLTEFLQIMRESNKRYDAAVIAEQYPNSATQDILHAIELAPSTIDFESIIPTLHQLRADRRTTKQELEVTSLIKDWFIENEKGLNKLQNVLGQVRKILERQPNDMYCWKTDIIGEKGQWLSADKIDEEQ